MPLPPSKTSIEEACRKFLDLGIGENGKGHAVIRSGHLGACVASREEQPRWVDAFWTEKEPDKIVDVTGASYSSALLEIYYPQRTDYVLGAGNSFLGGLAAGLSFTRSVYEGMHVIGER